MNTLSAVLLLALVATSIASPLIRNKRFAPSSYQQSFHSPLHIYDCHDDHDQHCHQGGHLISFGNDYNYHDYGHQYNNYAHYDYHGGHGGHAKSSYQPAPSYKPKVVIIKKIVPLSTTTQYGR